MRVVFMGTPDIAVAPLQAIIDAGHEVVLVVSQPDRPKGRGGKVAMPPVKQLALKYDIPVLQPSRVRGDAAFAEQLKSLAPDVAVVIAFGQILPQAVLDIPKFGCINIHASLLPKYRGAAPINWAIAKGETETGLTTMQMDAGMDTGGMLLTATTAIGPQDDAAILTERLGGMAGPLIVETLGQLAGGLTATAQDNGAATMAPMLSKADGTIDWSRPAVEIVNRIKAFSVWPGSFTSYRGERWKVVVAQTAEGRLEGLSVGTIARVDGDSILVACGVGGVRIGTLQIPGKRAMSVRDFLNGRSVDSGQVLGDTPAQDS